MIMEIKQETEPNIFRPLHKAVLEPPLVKTMLETLERYGLRPALYRRVAPNILSMSIRGQNYRLELVK